MNINRILVPVDFSHNTTHLIDAARTFAEKFDAELIFYHVIDERVMLTSNVNYMPPNYAPIPVMDQSILDNFVESSQKTLEELAEKDGLAGLKITTICEEGIPYTSIKNFAEKQKADLILIGSHGHTGLKHLFLGSVADYISHHSKIPVLIIKVEQKK
ncbi:MAG: universal stress protein [Spirochaetes bacterium]|nr:universal stress protein [Spirochaetota bacterium]